MSPESRNPTSLDPPTLRTIIGDVARVVREEYVEPDVGARAAERLEQSLADGLYDSFRQPAGLAERLNDQLYEIVQDRHLKVVAFSGPLPLGSFAVRPQINEFGVVRADRLAGDIGYLEIVGFDRSPLAREATNRAMIALADTRALIIDARQHRGGSRHGAAYLLSFFVDGSTPIRVMDFLWRRPGTEFYRMDEPTFTSVTPTSYLGKPLYVLAGPTTFSGGEEFCYDIKALKLGTLVGETTRGGGNPVQTRRISVGFAVSLPCGKAVSPITGGNWEKVGVTPDIATSADAALKTALERLGESPQATRVDDLSQARLFQMRSAPMPGAEVALRNLIGGLATGLIDEDQLTPALATAVHHQLDASRARLTALGPLQSVVFRGPNMGGDSFEVRFAHGSEIRTLFFSDGKVAASFVARVQPRPDQQDALDDGRHYGAD